MMGDDPPPRPEPPRDGILRIAVALLALVVIAQIALPFGRGIGCAFIWNRQCSTEEYQAAGEQLAQLTATVMALVFALVKK